MLAEERHQSFDAIEATLTDEDIELSTLFSDPIRVLDPKVLGVVQKVDWRIIQERMRRVINSDRYWFLTHGVLLMNSIAMIAAPRARDDESSSRYQGAHALMIFSLVFNCFEMLFYCVANGVLSGQQSTQEDPRTLKLLAVLAVWSPPRLRQSSLFAAMNSRAALPAATSQLHRPLFTSPVRCAEVVLIVLSVIGYIIPVASPYHILRFLHGLRSMRLLSITLLSDLAAALGHAVTMLLSSATFVAFIFVVFGVVAVDPFGGALSMRCMTIDVDLATQLNVTIPFPLPAHLTASNFCTPSHRVPCREVVPPLPCAMGVTEATWFLTRVCPSHMACREVGPAAALGGYPSFDNFGVTLLTLVHITSMDNWSFVMYHLFSVAHPAIIGAYFFVLIVVTAFILFNVITAVVSSSFAKVVLDAKLAQKPAKHWLVQSELDRFLHWKYSRSAVHHLSFRTGKFHRNGDPVTLPFVNHIRYMILMDLFLLAVVAVNAANSDSAATDFKQGVATLEIVYASFQFLELVVSLLAHSSLHNFLSQRANVFELCSAAITAVGLAIGVHLSVIRSLRFIRWVTHLGVVGTIVSRSAAALFPTLKVCVFLAVSAVVVAGVYLQSFSPISATSPSTSDFGDSASALLRTLQHATVDGWEQSMYFVMAQRHWLLGVLYFIPGYTFFGYVVMSLFVAVMVFAQQPSDEEKVALQKQRFGTLSAAPLFDASGAIHLKSALVADVHQIDEQTVMSQAAADLAVVQTAEERRENAAAGNGDRDEQTMMDTIALGQGYDNPMKSKKLVRDKSFALFSMENAFRRFLIAMLVDINDIDPGVRRHYLGDEADDVDGKETTTTTASGAPRPKSRRPNVYGQYFHPVIMLVVIGSCVQLFFATGDEACSVLDENRATIQDEGFFIADVFFVAFFSVEAIFKMIVHGVFFPGQDRPWFIGVPYFRDLWNILDFGLLACMVAAFFVPQARALRVLRALRPLRVIRRSERMRQLVSGVVSALPPVATLFIYLFYVIFVCAVVGLNLFSGKFYRCSVDTIDNVTIASREQCVGVEMNSRGVLAPVSWGPASSHCDDVWSCTVFVIEIVTMSNFNSYLTQVSNVAGEGLQPRRQTSATNVLFCLAVTLFISFTFLNFVVGVVLLHIEAHRGVLLLTRDQRDWHFLLDDVRAMKPTKPHPKTPFVRLQKIVLGWYFEMFINGAIFVNIMLLATVHYNQDPGWDQFQFYANVVFLIIFIIEIILKLMVLGLHYFKSLGNVFDVLVVLGSIIEISVELSRQGSASSSATSVIRAFRIVRVFRGMRRVDSLRSMFLMLWRSAVSLIALTGLIIIMLFLFAVLGMTSFGSVRFSKSITPDANFRVLDSAFFLVFRLLTLDNWADMMHEYRDVSPPYCNAKQVGWRYRSLDTNALEACGVLDDCGNFASQFFFLGMVFLGSFFLVGVIIATLLDSFNYISAQTRMPIRQTDLDRFQLSWRDVKRHQGVPHQFDATIHPDFLSTLVIDLFNDGNALVKSRGEGGVVIHPVLTPNSRLMFKKLISELKAMAAVKGLPLDGYCSFQNVMVTCCRLQFGRRGLTMQQAHEREAIDICIVSAVVGERFRLHLRPMVAAARARLAERGALKALNVTLQTIENNDEDAQSSPVLVTARPRSASTRFAIPSAPRNLEDAFSSSDAAVAEALVVDTAALEEEEELERGYLISSYMIGQEAAQRHLIGSIELNTRTDMWFDERAERHVRGDDLALAWVRRVRSPPRERADEVEVLQQPSSPAPPPNPITLLSQS